MYSNYDNCTFFTYIFAFSVCTGGLLHLTFKIWLLSNNEKGPLADAQVDILKSCRINVVKLSEQLHGGNYTYRSLGCLSTKTEPSFHMCTYPSKRDRFISSALQTDGIWEPYITSIMQVALNKYPKGIFIDVGANIGYYSLMAAKRGHTTIAIEPKEENLLRLQMGVDLNHVSNEVYLVQNVLYDVHTNVTMTNSDDNQGGVWIKSIISEPKSSPENESLVEAVTMDHL